MAPCPEALTEVVARLSAACDIERLYLYGSRARGNARTDSDYDLMMVVDDDVVGAEGLAKMVLLDVDVPVDLLAWPSGLFDEWACRPGSLPWNVVHDGRLLLTSGRAA